MKIINIGVLAHVDAGKTTLTESLLYNSGAITVLYRSRCQVGTLHATVVTERMPCVVEGYMEASPTMV